jgi:chaperonin GroEL
VATISAGDPLIGQLIAEAVLYVGKEGGILTEKAPITEVEREYVDGYYLQSGFTALQASKKELNDPLVVVSNKKLSSAADAVEILNGIMKAKGLQPGQVPRILFVGNVEDAAYQVIVDSINKGLIDAIIVKTPPMYGEYGKYLLQDVATYAGCEMIGESTSLKQFVTQLPNQQGFASPFIGSFSKAVASKSEATLFGDNTTEAVKTRTEELRSQIKDEQSPAVLEKLKDRLSKLEGKICLFKIGAPTDTAKEELEFRVEDAINSTRHAHAEGVVAGGGVTLLELSKLNISDIFMNALRLTFQELLKNANLPTELKLDEALRAPKGHGYNLRKGDELVDVVKEGIIDAVVVPREVIRNAASAVGGMVTIGASLIYTTEDK